MVCLKEIVNNQGCPIKKYAGDLVRMRLEFSSGHNTVENETGVWQSSWKDGIRSYRSSVGGVGCPQVWIQDVLKTISGAQSQSVSLHSHYLIHQPIYRRTCLPDSSWGDAAASSIVRQSARLFSKQWLQIPESKRTKAFVKSSLVLECVGSADTS